jgi:RNA recognition motif-containing protein
MTAFIEEGSLESMPQPALRCFLPIIEERWPWGGGHGQDTVRCAAQCILLRDKERLDEAGEPRSRGAGFIEFAQHDHAMACLRQMNNNPALFGGAGRRPIVAFAVESVKALATQERRKRAAAELQERRSMAEGAVSHSV